jgi:glycosyltransferase involved in cell wall biosynthesis
MIDATILIPTHRHPALLPYAVRSALAQGGAEIEVFVVGDGVEDATRTALKPFLDENAWASNTGTRHSKKRGGGSSRT